MTVKHNPTNNDLGKMFHEGFKALNSRIDKVEEKVDTFHDFMVVQKDRDTRVSTGAGLNVSPDIIKLALLLAGIIAALVGAKAIQ